MAGTDKKCKSNSDCYTNQTCSSTTNTCVNLKVPFSLIWLVLTASFLFFLDMLPKTG